MTVARTRKKQARGGFQKGQSGNPNGRPEGSRNKVTLAIEALLEGDAEALTRKAIEKALEGDMTAIRLCLDRLCPPRKDRPVSLKLPQVATTRETVEAIRSVLEAVGDGDITPSEGQALAAMIETQRRTLETEDIERRLAELEKRQAEK